MNSNQNLKTEIFDELRPILLSSQHTRHNAKSKCVKQFMKLYEKMFGTENFDDFINIFILMIKCALYGDKGSPYTKRCIDFIAFILNSILIFEEKKEEERLENVIADEMKNHNNDHNNSYIVSDDDELGVDPDQTLIEEKYLPLVSNVDLLFQKHFFRFLQFEDVNFRYNTTSLIKKTLEHLDELDESTYNGLREAMKERSFDKDKAIRSLAILSMNKLQDSSNPEDTIISNLKFHLLYDPDPMARFCALKTLEVNPESLKALYVSTRDANVGIRKTAYTKIAQNCEIHHFIADDRHRLLMNGAYEREESVRNVIFKQLIPAWIKRLDNDILKFLEYLNIKKDLSFSDYFLSSYYATLLKSQVNDSMTKFHEFVFDFKHKYLDEYKLLTKEMLTEESSFAWYTISHFCKKHNITYNKEVNNVLLDNVDQNDEESNYQIMDLIDEIIPDVPIYCNYIEAFVERTLQNPTHEKIKEMQFIFIQLLKLGQHLRISDSAQWAQVSKIFFRILQWDECFEIFENYIEEIMVIFSNYFDKDDQAFLDHAFDLINAINNPERVEPETFGTDYQQHRIQLEELIKEKKERLTEYQYAADSSELETIAQLKLEIAQLEEKRESLIETQLVSDSAVTCDRIETDKTVFQRCLHICHGFFSAGRLKCNLPLLSSMINKLILPGLEFNDMKIRLLAVRTLGLYCLPSIEQINHFLKVFIEISDSPSYGETRVWALKFLFDFVCFHGFKEIRLSSADYQDSDEQTEIPDQAQIESVEPIMDRCDSVKFINLFGQMIANYMEEPTIPDRYRNNMSAYPAYQLFETTIQGLCKIMDLGRFYSAEFLARLIVIYFSYETIEQKLKQYIKGFFYVYTINFRKYMQKHFNVACPFVDSYKLCLQTLLETLPQKMQTEDMYEEVINFYLNIVNHEYHLLAMEAAEMLKEEFNPLWAFNLRVISKADLHSFTTTEELEKLLQMVEGFQMEYLPPETYFKSTTGRTRVKLSPEMVNSKKNYEYAKKIITRLQQEIHERNK